MELQTQIKGVIAKFETIKEEISSNDKKM